MCASAAEPQTLYPAGTSLDARFALELTSEAAAVPLSPPSLDLLAMSPRDSSTVQLLLPGMCTTVIMGIIVIVVIIITIITIIIIVIIIIYVITHFSVGVQSPRDSSTVQLLLPGTCTTVVMGIIVIVVIRLGLHPS